MRDIYIYGAGGFGRECLLMIQQINTIRRQWDVKGFFDDGKSKGSSQDNYVILGGLDELNAMTKKISVVIAIANGATRKDIVGKIKNNLIDFPTIAHPRSNLGDLGNSFGRGSVVTEGCIFTTGIRLGAFNIINLSSTIGHDVSTGDFVSIMPGCHVSGNVKIGERTMLGTGSTILQNLSVGDGCKVGAGAIVTRSFANDLTLVGVPAKIRNE